MTKTKSQKARAKAARNQRVRKARQLPPKPSARRRLPVRPVFKLSDCAQKYLQALENPFTGIVACVPTMFTMPSQKGNFWCKGSFYTGTAGYGYITVNPRFCVWFNSTSATSGGMAAVIYTQSSYTGTAAPLYSDTGIGIDCPVVPYPPSPGVTARVVACGLRIRNVTPMLNRGGLVAMLEMPGHITAVGSTYSSINSTAESGTGDINGKWTSVTWHPFDDDEIDFKVSTVDGTNSAPGPNVTPCLVGAVSAPASTPQQYEYEVRICVEYGGVSVRNVTPTDSDPSGMAAINNARTVQDLMPIIGDRTPRVRSELFQAAVESAKILGGMAAVGAINSARRMMNPPQYPRIESID